MHALFMQWLYCCEMTRSFLLFSLVSLGPLFFSEYEWGDMTGKQWQQCFNMWDVS